MAMFYKKVKIKLDDMRKNLKQLNSDHGTDLSLVRMDLETFKIEDSSGVAPLEQIYDRRELKQVIRGIELGLELAADYANRRLALEAAA